MLMRSAAAAFGNTGHFMPTFQEAFMLMDQVMYYLHMLCYFLIFSVNSQICITRIQHVLFLHA